MASWITAAGEGELGPGQVKVVEAGEKRLALCNVDGEYYCIDDVCTHDGGSLDQGEVFGDEIECPRHGARFDVKTGRALILPAVLPVETYETRVQGGQVQVQVDE
ncbi:MAG TPA: non-heme iron oxygenase ferredoxin subunit [Chloroflexota bacterium]|nr:non-heme iron oxygenase ferredoxin subunit [Chloroflexota bacterium]